MAHDIPGRSLTGPNRIIGPAGRQGRHTRPGAGSTTFDEALHALAEARIAYEQVRSAGISTIADRFEARRRLDGHRLDVARLRRELT